MDFCSYNVRGLNNKTSFIKDFIRNNNLGLLGLLETRVKKENASSIASFLSPSFNWLFNYDHHENGRIWIGWDPSLWRVVHLATTDQHISCSVTRLATSESFFISFVYAFNTYMERKPLWSSLLSFQASITVDNEVGSWCILGDFNVCLKLDEINGGSLAWTLGMSDFKNFISNAKVVDLNFSGSFFSWWDSNVNSPLLKKLDRVLINDTWMGAFPLSRAVFLPRGLSDHSPASVLMGLSREKLKKPFQVYQHILSAPTFLSTVEEVWSSPVFGDPWYVLTQKLKRVKQALVSLNKSRGDVHDRVSAARDALLQFQADMPLSPAPAQFLEEAKLSSELELFLKEEEVFLRQKSRIQWLHLGDGNNKFFFNACKGRWNSNKILSLVSDQGETLTSHKDISKVAVEYYQSILGSSTPVTDFDDEVNLPLLTDTQKAYLTAPFSPVEVLRAFKAMAKNRSPGPDGFSTEFYLTAWNVVGADVVRGILHFFQTNDMPRIINATAIALIPKVDCPANMSHYRPISCCNTLYKCIAKLLAGRLKLLLPHLISPNQSAFISKRSIGDNIMLAQALVKDYHLSGPSRCAIKLDIRKAFDSLNWDFLFNLMFKMGFPSRFIAWIKNCVTTSMISIKINGSLEGFFKSKSGLRQGDPLSPYLFVLAMQVLTCYLNHDLGADGNFNYHWRTKELKLSHLIFADDLLLFCKGDQHSISAMLNSVNRFSAVSGLFPNPAKCLCFFSNVSEEVMHTTLHSTGFQLGEFPIKYLGLPLISSSLKTADCIPLVQRLCAKIDSWTSRFLKLAGRLQLIKSILFSIQGYWATYLFLPKCILKQIQSYISNFFWGGTHVSTAQHKVSWQDCCLPHSDGGLGVRDLFEWNRASILYQIWRLTQPGGDSIWILWLHNCLFKNKSFWTAKIPYKCSWSVRKLLNYRHDAIRHLKFKVGENSSFLLWHDPWLIGKPLIDHFGVSVISAAQSTSLAKVSSIITSGAWTPCSSNHMMIIELRELLSNCSISSHDDTSWDGVKPVKLAVVWDSIRRTALPPLGLRQLLIP